MNDKVKQTLKTILDTFKSGNIPEAVAVSMFPIANIPVSNWSLLNRTLVFLSGTKDARGFKQWQKVNRFVQKGSKALYIMVPFIKKEKDENEKQRLIGFGCKSVFRVEDTEGEFLEYEQIKLPELPLIERAEELGISVKAIPGNYKYYGAYFPKFQTIELATPEEKTFFHELSHAAHEKIRGELKTCQNPLQEIIAELSAQALCRIVGKKVTDTTGNSYHYIEKYAEKIQMNPYNACLKVLSETEKVLNIVLNKKEINHVR